jgi:hypothetical protein
MALVNRTLRLPENRTAKKFTIKPRENNSASGLNCCPQDSLNTTKSPFIAHHGGSCSEGDPFELGAGGGTGNPLPQH